MDDNLSGAGADLDIEKMKRERIGMYKTILVPLDGSDVATSVLEPVVELARGFDAQLVLLTVGPPIPGVVTGASDIQLSITFQAQDKLDRLQASLVTQGLKVTTMVRIGDPASEILRVAETQPVDLILMNSRGGDGAASPFVGSVAAKVAGASTVPVLVTQSSGAHSGPD